MPLQLYEKEKILDACFTVFVKNGYTHTTTAVLAESAGISKALIFHHFKSKKALYLSVLERCFKNMESVVNDENMDDYTDYFEARSKSGYLRIEYLKKHQDVNKIILEAFYNTPDELKEDIQKFRAHMETKRGSIHDKRGMKLKELFDNIPMREGVDRALAYELVEIIMQHFNKKHLSEMVDEDKIMDKEFWQEFKEKKSLFLDMLRFGIEQKKD